MTLLFQSDGTPYIELSPKASIRLERDPLDEKDLKKARAELRECPENVEEGIRVLRELIKAEPDFEFPEDEEYMKEFLRPCKYYTDSTIQLMRRYYQFKVKHPNICKDILPSGNTIAFEQGVISFMPRRDKEGRRILVIQIGSKWDTSSCSLWDLFKALELALEAAMNEPKTQVHGVSALLDMKGLSLRHVYQFTPSFAKLAAGWVQDCVPIRLKGVHVVNQPYLFDMLFTLFKPFLGQKLRKRIYFHGTDFEALCSHLGSECLRPNYGGDLDAPECDGKLLSQLLCHYEDQFKLAASFGYKTKSK